jgi:hypothetical protein
MTPLEDLVEAAIAAFAQALGRDDVEAADRYVTLALVLAEYRQLKAARS